MGQVECGNVHRSLAEEGVEFHFLALTFTRSGAWCWLLSSHAHIAIPLLAHHAFVASFCFGLTAFSVLDR